MPEVVTLGFQFAPLLVDREEPVEVGVVTASSERLANGLRLLPEELSGDHLSDVATPRGKTVSPPFEVSPHDVTT